VIEQLEGWHMLLIRLIALAVALLMVAGCEGMFSLSEPCVFPQGDVALYENWLGVKLPGSTSNFSVRCSRWMDHHQFWMQFNIAPDDLATLQAGMPSTVTWQENVALTDAQMDRVRRLVSGQALNQMRSYVAAIGPFNDLIAIVNTSDAQAYRVFLYVFRSF
jgi:hypothetical protein